ncbi:hypothetical protein THIOSC13_420005 [uncultured Thiomicrorhabdus sp.]
MSNYLEDIYYDLPKVWKDKVDKEDPYFSDCYCQSLSVISDYIITIESQLKEAVEGLEHLQKVGTGECQVANDDTEGMNYVARYSEDLLTRIREIGNG